MVVERLTSLTTAVVRGPSVGEKVAAIKSHLQGPNPAATFENRSAVFGREFEICLRIARAVVTSNGQ